MGIQFQTKTHLGSTCVQVHAVLRKGLDNENQWSNSIHHKIDIQRKIQLPKQRCLDPFELPWNI